jgi:hypothetical protein
VDDPFRVRGLQGISALDSDVNDLRSRQRPPLEPSLQRLAFEQLHRDEALPVGLVVVVDRADVRVIQRRGRLGLPLEVF